MGWFTVASESPDAQGDSFGGFAEPDVHGDETQRLDFMGPILALLGANAFLATFKLWLGYRGLSPALSSNGWNNTADFFYGLLLGVGLWVSSRPPDASHPEGHERFESLLSLGVALVILLTGLKVLRDAYGGLMAPRASRVGLLGIGLLVLSMAVKGLVSVYCWRASRRNGYSSLRTIGWDQAIDVLVDVSVVVAVFGPSFGLLWLDPLVAAGIGLFILTVGGQSLRESIHYLTGRSPSDQLLERVTRCTNDIDVFSEPFAVRAHYVGPTIHLSLNVKADSDRTLGDVHEAEETLRRRLLDLGDVSRVFIHVEPYGADSPN